MTRLLKRVEYLGCPLCDSENLLLERISDCSRHPKYSTRLPYQIFWKTCQDCSHSFVSGFFEAEALDFIAKKEGHAQIFSAKKVEQWRPLSSKIVSLVSSFREGHSGRWLDIGFGTGALLLAAEEFGYQATGLELRGSSVDALKPYLENVFQKDFLTMDSNERFDVISFADVLEHMPFPKKALTQAQKLLNPGGLLFISLPNYNSPLWKILTEKKQNPYWSELEHYHNFSRQRLSDLLEEKGFRPCYFGVSERYRLCMEMVALKTG